MDRRSTRTVVLENDGPLPVTIDAATVSPPFALAASSTCGATLDAVARCNYDVTFSAQQVGPVTGALDVAIAGGHFAAELDGAGGDYVNVAVQGAGVVTSSPPGIDCGTTCSGLFSSPVTLAATPDPGLVFTDWSPAICTTTTCVVSPGESITAKFSPAPAYTVGGTVSGLTTTGLILQNNGGDDLTIAGDGSFTFATPIASGLAYQVTVHQQPAGAGCRIENGSGTIGPRTSRTSS